jgi:NAD-dependent dihydropyrimidine dehydrogenase PreA subunit
MIHASDSIHPALCALMLAAGSVVLGHVAFSRDKPVRVGGLHYFFHWLYGMYEPQILRLVDWIMRRKFISGNPPGREVMKILAMTGHYLPHGIVATTRAVSNLVRHIETLPGGDDGPRLAVGPCVCQMALDRWKEPSCKDIVVLYGADIYLHLERGYRIIDAKEAVRILEECRDAGLVHSLDFCMQSGKWHFVICNCDAEICVLARAYLMTGRMMYAGPQIVKQERPRCLGAASCGKCVDACMFGANYERGGSVFVDAEKCMGCGQCVRACTHKARTMRARPDYRHDAIIPSEILLS